MFCNKCGKEINGNLNFCDNCGNPLNNNVNISNNPLNYAANMNNGSILIKQLSGKYKMNGTIWIIVAAIQIIFSLILSDYWLFLIVGVLNLISGIQDIVFSNSMLTNYKGIVDKVKPLAGPIITLIYNLIFGGVLGVAGSIYYLVGIRNFVMTNENAFRSLEA